MSEVSEYLALDIWSRASAFQLLHLLKILNIEQQSIANFLHVTPSSLSMWVNGHRATPEKYREGLLEYARSNLEHAALRHYKEVQALPDDLRAAAIEAFYAPWSRWTREVLHEQGILQHRVQHDARRIGQYADVAVLTASDRRSLMTLCRGLQASLRTLEALAEPQQNVEDPEDV
jgi:hypothetical protein